MAEWFGKLLYKTDTYENDLNCTQLDVAYLCINSQRHDEIEPIMYATAQRLGSLSSSDELGLTSLFCEKKQRMIESKKKNRICMKLISLPSSRPPVSLPSLPLCLNARGGYPRRMCCFMREVQRKIWLNPRRRLTISIFGLLKCGRFHVFFCQGLTYSTAIKDGLTFLSSQQQL